MPPRALPSLVTEPPLAANTFWVTSSPFAIGRARTAGALIDHPLVELQHAILVEREDGWWITSARPLTLLNGAPIPGGSRLLATGDRIQLAGGATVVFRDGRVVAPPPVAAEPQFTPLAARRRRRQWRPTLRLPSWHVSRRAALIFGVVVVAVAAAGFGVWRWNKQRAQEFAARELSPAEGLVLDSLLSVAFDHIERGNVLLELDADNAALEEFAAGLAIITSSHLRSKPDVILRAAELRASVREVYLSHKMSVPSAMAGGTNVRSIRGQGLVAALSVSQFSSAVDALRNEFLTTYGAQLEVTGRDHAEHLSLYGPSSAIDVRTKTLTAQQVQFVIAGAQRTGVRVKDFSQDAVLQAQVAAAIRAGKSDLAGTGLHMHLDRFANRNDRWTVSPASGSKPGQ